MTSNLWNGSWRGRAPSGDSHRRSREVISPSGGIMRSKFPSRKNGRLVHCEGLLELDAAHLFELVSGKTIRVEVKPETSLLDAEVRNKLEMVGAHMRRLDEAFVVLTDVELRRQPGGTLPGRNRCFERACAGRGSPRLAVFLGRCNSSLDPRGRGQGLPLCRG